MTPGTSRRWAAAVGAAALPWLIPALAAGQDPEAGGAPLDGVPAHVQSFVDVMQPVVQAAMRGHLAEREKPFAFVPKPSFIRGVDGRMYVPYTVTVAGREIDSPAVEVYICVAERTDPESAPPPDPLSDGPACTFEDAYAADANRTSDESVYLNRAFDLHAGDYDAYVAIRDEDGGPAGGEDAPAAATTPRAGWSWSRGWYGEGGGDATIMLVKEAITVPDFWASELQIGLIVGAVEPVDAPLTPERQMREPYTIGTYRVTPAYRLSFSRSEELTFFYVVYGAGPPGGAKPDLTVEYHFLRRTAGGEAYFTETEPERLNAHTMPPEFDMTLGHTIAGGRGVPLAPFPAGEYRLEIGVTDHTSGASVTREVTFTVQAP